MIDRDQVMSMVTDTDIIEIMADLGATDYKHHDTNGGGFIFRAICHNDYKYKLYYFSTSKMFMCFNRCGSQSLYDVVMNVLQVKFEEAFLYICKFKNISLNTEKPKGLQKKIEVNKDLDFLKVHLYKKPDYTISLPSYNNNILKIFDDFIPSSWYDEGINLDIAKYFDIKIYFNQMKAIIPHYDIKGNLVGIRGRNFNKQQIENGCKYMPVTIQGLMYRYPMNFNLYGIYQNQHNIKQFKKAIIFEGEKSVLIYGSYFGQENNISLAICGMNFSNYQRNLLLSLGIEEIIIALDKQYQIELMEDKNNKDEHNEYVKYIKRLINITDKFINYCKVSIITCWDDRLDYKDAPIDKGKIIFTELFKERYLISDTEELKEMMA